MQKELKLPIQRAQKINNIDRINVEDVRLEELWQYEFGMPFTRFIIELPEDYKLVKRSVQLFNESIVNGKIKIAMLVFSKKLNCYFEGDLLKEHTKDCWNKLVEDKRVYIRKIEEGYIKKFNRMSDFK